MKFIYALLIILLVQFTLQGKRRSVKRIKREEESKDIPVVVKGPSAYFICKLQKLIDCAQHVHCQFFESNDKIVFCGDKHPLNENGEKAQGDILEDFCATFPSQHCPTVCKSRLVRFFEEKEGEEKERCIARRKPKYRELSEDEVDEVVQSNAALNGKRRWRRESNTEN